MTFSVPARAANSSVTATDVATASLADFFADITANGMGDFADVSDAQTTGTITENLVCPNSTDFACTAANFCLGRDHVCDGIVDCWDGSDESDSTCDNVDTSTIFSTRHSSPSCGGQLLNGKTWGTFSHGNYPNHYLGNQDCTWEVQTTADYIVVIEFNEFVLHFTDNCDTDFVEVSYDGGSIGKFCGKYPNPNMPSRRLTILSSGAGLINC